MLRKSVRGQSVGAGSSGQFNGVMLIEEEPVTPRPKPTHFSQVPKKRVRMDLDDPDDLEDGAKFCQEAQADYRIGGGAVDASP